MKTPTWRLHIFLSSIKDHVSKKKHQMQNLLDCLQQAMLQDGKHCVKCIVLIFIVTDTRRAKNTIGYTKQFKTLVSVVLSNLNWRAIMPNNDFSVCMPLGDMSQIYAKKSNIGHSIMLKFQQAFYHLSSTGFPNTRDAMGSLPTLSLLPPYPIPLLPIISHGCGAASGSNVNFEEHWCVSQSAQSQTRVRITWQVDKIMFLGEILKLWMEYSR